MDQNALKVILFFNNSLASCKNKEYLITVLKHWLYLCKEFFSEHFLDHHAYI